MFPLFRESRSVAEISRVLTEEPYRNHTVRVRLLLGRATPEPLSPAKALK